MAAHIENNASSEITNTRKDRQHHALAAWGNYHNYYFHRANTTPDARLSLLPPHLFTGKRVLDLGCNAGKLTIECSTHLGAAEVLGIDLDRTLIETAQQELEKTMEQRKESHQSCNFLCDDFMRRGYFETLLNRLSIEAFDTIVLFSVTKWLHIHHGDEGLLCLFEELFRVLPPSGNLVIEPQEWNNYKRAVSKNKNLKPVFKTLKMRPDFIEELQQIGFILDQRIEREEGGFSRPLMLWRKP